MLKLCGFAGSNYHNKVKLALLEKGVPFEEELAWVGATDASASPLGKVPYLKTPDGAMCESAVMLEYIEQKYPQNPLIPADPFAAAKVRELALFLDLHLELVARNLYPEAFFGGKVSDAAKQKTGEQLTKKGWNLLIPASVDSRNVAPSMAPARKPARLPNMACSSIVPCMAGCICSRCRPGRAWSKCPVAIGCWWAPRPGSALSGSSLHCLKPVTPTADTRYVWCWRY